MQRVVDELDVLAQVEIFVRLVRLLQGPVVVVAVKNADFGNHLGVLERGREQLQFLADLADFHEDAVVAFDVVRQDGAVKFFAADPGLAPAEIKDAARAAGNELVGEEPDQPGLHERIHVLPVDLADFLFHGPETAIAVGRSDARLFQRAQQVNVAGQFGGFGLHDDVAFDGDKVHNVRHVEVIIMAEESAHGDGDGMLRALFVQEVGLHLDELHHRVAAKAVPIEQQGRVVHRRRIHRHRHLVPGGHGLPPEAQAQLLVQALNRFVFGLEPEMPFLARGFVEGEFGVVAAHAVVNLPRDELRMVAQRLGHRGDDALGIIPEDIAAQTDRAARAFVFDPAEFVEREDFRMFFGEPDGRRGGRRAEHDLDAVMAHDVHDAAQPEEIVFALFGFAEAPGKLADADDVDAGLGHQRGVALPSGLGIVGGAGIGKDPMFGIIISAKKHNLASRASPDSKSKTPLVQSQNGSNLKWPGGRTKAGKSVR